MNRREFFKRSGVACLLVSSGKALSTIHSGGVVVEQFNMFGVTSIAHTERAAKYHLMCGQNPVDINKYTELRNPVALLYNLVRENMDNICVDHDAFLTRLQDCKVLIDPASVPEGPLLNKVSFLAVKSNSIVTLLNQHMHQLTIREVNA